MILSVPLVDNDNGKASPQPQPQQTAGESRDNLIFVVIIIAIIVCGMVNSASAIQRNRDAGLKSLIRELQVTSQELSNEMIRLRQTIELGQA